MVKGEINKQEYLMLEGLLVLRNKCRDEHTRIECAIAELLGVEPESGYGDYYGCVSDVMFEDTSAKELLNQLDIKIKNGN